MSATRRGLLALLAVIAAAFVIVGMADAASAAPAVPGVPDCKDAPAAQEAGFGLAGVLDPKPRPLPPASDPFAGEGSIYDQYGYAGLRWSTYDLGCGGSVRDPGASVDTMTGNGLMGAAVTITSATNGLHNQVASPASYMGPLDRVVDRVTGEIHDSIWSPWGAVSLIGVAALLLVYSMRGQLSSAISAGAWSILVLAVLAGVAQYPSRASTFFDEAVTSTIGNVQASTAGVVTKSDSARAQGALTVDRVLYDSWLRGQLGASDSAAAKRWGPALFKASTVSWHESAAATTSETRKELIEQKADDWNGVAEEIADEDPATYQVLQGKAGGRAGVGLMALVGTIFTSLFRLTADIFLLVGLVFLRLLVMFLPAAAVIGILAPMSSVLRRMANLGGAALVNVVAFSVGAAVHTVAVSAVLEAGDGVGMTLMALILCVVLTLAAFVLMWPLLSFRLAFGSGGIRRPSMRRIGRHVASYVVTREAVENGMEDADKDGRDRPQSDAPSTPRPIPDDHPHPAPTHSRPRGEVLAYRPMGRSDATSTEAHGRAKGDPFGGTGAEPQPAAPSTDRVLVGTVVSSTTSEGPPSDRHGPARPAAQRPRPVQIYDPVEKRLETFRGIDGGGNNES